MPVGCRSTIATRPLDLIFFASLLFLVAFVAVVEAFHHPNQPDGLKLHISDHARGMFTDFKEATCRKKNTTESDGEHVNEYLSWEENAFLRQLRITLIPETTNGDLRTIVGTQLESLDTRLLSTAVESLCPRYYKEPDEEAVTQRDDFEDVIINLLLPSRWPATLAGRERD